MTSLSVRQYVLGVLKTYCQNAKEVTKLQSGKWERICGVLELWSWR